MEAKKLRIGNLVGIEETAIHADGCNHLEAIFEIEELKQDVALFKGFHAGEYYKDLKGIELNEDWLNKFGFTEQNKYEVDKLKIIPKGVLGYKNGRTYFNSWVILEKQPKFVHELQNLFFAITGQELELKHESSTCG